MPALASTLRTRPRAILVVDDCEAVVAVVRMVLRQLGFDDVDEAVDGEDALARLRERPFDLIISGLVDAEDVGLRASASRSI